MTRNTSRTACYVFALAARFALVVSAAILGVSEAPAVAPRGRIIDPPAAATPGQIERQELDGRNVHNVGRVLFHVTNFGLLGSMPGTVARFADAPSAQWPPGSRVEYLFAAGPWIGAIRRAEPHVSGLVETPDRVSFDFRPGASDIDRIYRTRTFEPHSARLPAADADGDGDGRIDEDPLNGRDDDGDGLIDEDFGAISDQMFTCEYADDDPAIRLAVPDHRPLGILVRQSTYAW